MAFDIGKARDIAKNNPSTPASTGGFNIEKAREFAGGSKPPGRVSVDTSGITSSVRDRTQKQREENKKIRVPFIQDKIKFGRDPIERFSTNILFRAVEDLIVGGLKTAATVTGKDVKIPGKITSEPFFTGETQVTTDTFKPMAQAALSRIEQLDVERPGSRRVNLIQGATEEVFLPLLDSLDILGIGSLATRLVRKATLSKPAEQAFKTLGMGVLSDVSEEGIRKNIANQVRDNLSKLEKGTITEKQFVQRQNEIGTALDTLTDSPRTRFGNLGERINRVTTALEAERKIGAAVSEKPLEIAKDVVGGATRRIEDASQTRKLLAESAENKQLIQAFTKKLDDAIDAKTRDDLLSDTPLTTEARKFNTAEEFVEAKTISVKSETKGSTTESIYIKEKGTGDSWRIDYVESKKNGEIKVEKYVRNEKGEYVFSDGKTKTSLEQKFSSNDIETIARKFTTGDENLSEIVSADLKTKAQLTDIFNGAKKTADEIIPETPKAKTPSKEQKVSKLGARINEILPEGSKIDEFYDVITISNELEKAAKAIEKNPTKALTDALNPEKSMSSRAAKLMEFAQSAKNRGDVGTQSAILSKMRVLGTEIAQGLNMFKAFGLRNPETDFMEQVVGARLRKVVISQEDISRYGTHGRAYNEKVYKPIKEDIEKITSKAFKVEDAQKLLDDLIC